MADRYLRLHSEGSIDSVLLLKDTGTVDAGGHPIVKLAADLSVSAGEAGSMVTPDADITQKITVATAGSPQQGPDKTNPGGWLLKAKSTNTGAAWFMYHGQTAANKGFPLGVGEIVYVPVLNLNSLDFDVAVSGNIIMASKC